MNHDKRNICHVTLFVAHIIIVSFVVDYCVYDFCICALALLLVLCILCDFPVSLTYKFTDLSSCIGDVRFLWEYFAKAKRGNKHVVRLCRLPPACSWKFVFVYF